MALPVSLAQEDKACSLESDDAGKYMDLWFPQEIGKNILDEGRFEAMASNELATARIYVSAASKRAVVVKEDNLLTKKGIADYPKDVADALYSELKIWLGNNCFNILDIAKAENITTSRCACKWKFVEFDKGN